MTSVCKVCGISADLKCGGCKIAVYCGRDHQKFDWKSGHKNQCKCFEVWSMKWSSHSEQKFKKKIKFERIFREKEHLMEKLSLIDQ